MMVNIAWVIIPLWIILGVILASKWEKAIDWDTTDEDNVVGIYVGSVLLAPLVLIITIIRQVFVEDWR